MHFEFTRLLLLFLLPGLDKGVESEVAGQVIHLQQPALAPPSFGTYAFGIGARDENAGIWPCNFWSDFEATEFAEDIRLLKLEGGNAVIVLFPFFDVDHPPAGAAGRLGQLKSLLELCESQHIALTLRLGYAWDNGFAESPALRQLSILTDGSERLRWYAFCRKTHELASPFHCFRGAFISWEDFWVYLHGASLDEAGRRAWASRIHYPRGSVPARRSPDMEEYFDRFDRLFSDDFFVATQRHFPGLGMEVRVDDDPIYDGARQLRSFVHQRMFSAPNLHEVYFYWGPFLGARNQGDQISGDEAVALLAQAIDKVRHLAVPGANLILAQFNYVDNTPGFSQNSKINPDELDAFIQKSCTLLVRENVSVYTWSNVPFYFNAIGNGTFSNGPLFWEFHQAVAGLDDGKPCVFVLPGGSIRQQIDANTVSSANLDLDTPIEVAFSAKSKADSRGSISLGDQASLLVIPGGNQWVRCKVMFDRPHAAGESLRISIPAGAALDDVVVSNHKQEVGAPHHVFPHAPAQASLAWVLAHAPAAPAAPVIVSGVTEDAWIQSRALISAPTKGGSFHCTVRLTVPSFAASQRLQVSLQPNGQSEELPLPPGQHSLIIRGSSPQPAVLISLSFSQHEKSTTTSTDVRELAAHLDSLQD